MKKSHPQNNPLPDSRLAAARLVMTCGVSGSGKTTFARRLEGLGFVRVSIDHIIGEEWGEKYSSLSPDERRRIFFSAFSAAEATAGRLLGEGKRVVVDATFCKRAHRDSMRALCANLGVVPTLVYLSADRATLLRRLACRQEACPDDRRVSEEELDGFLSHFEIPQPDENPILLPTS